MSSQSESASRSLTAWLLQGLLTGLGLVMSLVSRRVPRFRRQVTRDLVVEIGSADGARQQYRFVAATRRMHAPLHVRHQPEVTLRFGSARDGLRALLSTHTVGRIVEGMNTGETRIEGNPVLVLWFHGMTRVVAPIGSTRRPRRAAPVPVRAPEREAPYATRIITEPPVRTLSAQWPQAWRARSLLLHVRAPQGARLPEG